MIEETGRVVASDDVGIWVETSSGSACAKCAEGKGCGQGLFAQLFDTNRRIFIKTTKRVPVDSMVVLGLEEFELLKCSMLVYGVPLLGLILGTLLGQIVFELPELWVMAIALSGLLTGSLIVKFHRTGRESHYSFGPKLLKIAPECNANKPAVFDPNALLKT